MDEVEAVEEVIVEGAAGAPEGAPQAEPTTDDVAKMYKDLGIKASVPTGATKGRPKSSTVRAKDIPKDDDGDSEPGRKDDKSSEGKSKDAPADDKDGDSGDDADSKTPKDGKKDGKVQDKSDKTDDGVRKTESRAKEDSERGSEDGSDEGVDGAGQAADDKDGAEEEGEDDEKGKRPGKSNPEVEKRFQKLTAEIKARDELIEKQSKDLEEATKKQFESRVAQEDPEYTIDDFLKVRDEEDNILELDQNQAELAWRRWKDGYDGRKAEREAKISHERAAAEYQAEATRAVIESSVKAYDTLNEILDTYPQLQKGDQFDQEFSNLVMPIIEDAVIYQVGTEPGNPENYKPVIIGLKIDPKKILKAMDVIKKSKRSLPLNGLDDSVETRSNKDVPHSRSSDSTVRAANELMKELKINKRF